MREQKKLTERSKLSLFYLRVLDDGEKEMGYRESEKGGEHRDVEEMKNRKTNCKRKKPTPTFIFRFLEKLERTKM